MVEYLLSVHRILDAFLNIRGKKSQPCCHRAQFLIQVGGCVKYQDAAHPPVVSMCVPIVLTFL